MLAGCARSQEARLNHGQAQMRAGLYDDAIRDFTQAIKLAPADAFGYLVRGDAYAQKHDLDRALADYTRAIQLDPASADAWCGRGTIYLRKCDDDQAIRDLSKSIELKPDHVAFTNRGWALIRKADYDKALADLDYAVKTWPSKDSFDARGWAFFHKGDLASAEKDAKAALALDGDFAWARALAFRVQYAQGQTEAARAAAREFVKSGPKDPQAREVRLLFRYCLGEAPLDDLRDHPWWCLYEVAIRGLAVPAK